MGTARRSVALAKETFKSTVEFRVAVPVKAPHLAGSENVCTLLIDAKWIAN